MRKDLAGYCLRRDELRGRTLLDPCLRRDEIMGVDTQTFADLSLTLRPIPAYAGSQSFAEWTSWIPACAGMSCEEGPCWILPAQG